jgi:hypothetical protein
VVPKEISENLSTVVRDSGGELTPWFICELMTAHKRNISQILEAYHLEQSPQALNINHKTTPESFKYYPKTAFPYNTIREPIRLSNSATNVWKFLSQTPHRIGNSEAERSAFSRYI